MQHSNASMDVARGVSALVVFSGHISQVFFWKIWGFDSWQAHFAGLSAQAAVAVFFVLSGHLITRSILANVKRNGTFDAADYLAARITRIYPPLIGAIAICAAVWGLIHGLGLHSDRANLRLGEIGRALTMQDGMLDINGPLWSLFVEFRLYIVAMAVAAWWRGSRFAAVGATILAIWAVAALKPQPWWCLIWGLGSLTAVLGWRFPGAAVRWPRALISSGGYSYSLYILHFPLLLLVAALTPAGFEPYGAGIAAISILAVVIPFARVAENQRFFKDLIKTR